MSRRNPADFLCIDCKQTKPVQASGGTGYATTNRGKVCYACCAERDKAYMRKHNRITLYLAAHHDESCFYWKACFKPQHWRVTNWPGTLDIPADHISTSKGWGFGRRYTRRDVRFTFEGQPWYGRNAGDNQILRARKTKR